MRRLCAALAATLLLAACTKTPVSTASSKMTSSPAPSAPAASAGLHSSHAGIATSNIPQPLLAAAAQIIRQEKVTPLPSGVAVPKSELARYQQIFLSPAEIDLQSPFYFSPGNYANMAPLLFIFEDIAYRNLYRFRAQDSTDTKKLAQAGAEAMQELESFRNVYPARLVEDLFRLYFDFSYEQTRQLSAKLVDSRGLPGSYDAKTQTYVWRAGAAHDKAGNLKITEANWRDKQLALRYDSFAANAPAKSNPEYLGSYVLEITFRPDGTWYYSACYPDPYKKTPGTVSAVAAS